jgi:hypothetical protein
MKELWSRKFWQDVKKTFDDARAEPAPPGDEAKASDVKPGSGDAPAATAVPDETIHRSD